MDHGNHLMTLVTCTGTGTSTEACTTRHLGPYLTSEQCVDDAHSIGGIIPWRHGAAGRRACRGQHRRRQPRSVGRCRSRTPTESFGSFAPSRRRSRISTTGYMIGRLRHPNSILDRRDRLARVATKTAAPSAFPHSASDQEDNRGSTPQTHNPARSGAGRRRTGEA